MLATACVLSSIFLVNGKSDSITDCVKLIPLNMSSQNNRNGMLMGAVFLEQSMIPIISGMKSFYKRRLVVKNYNNYTI